MSEQAKRRRFTAEYKLRIVREADACKGDGDVAALLSREGLYSSHLSSWRRQRDEVAQEGLASRKRGRKAKAEDPRVKELERENARLQRRLARVETMLVLHGRAKSALKEIMKAETKQLADVAVKRFDTDFGKYPKAVASLTKHQDELLTFYDFPAEHWDHIRTTNPIESAFATVRLRQRVTNSKGAGSRSKALLMAYKLLDMASLRWRRVKAPGLVARLMQGGKFVDGIEENLKRSAA